MNFGNLEKIEELILRPSKNFSIKNTVVLGRRNSKNGNRIDCFRENCYKSDKYTNYQYLGNLYTTVNPEQIKENALLLNARINYQAFDWMNFFVRGENLLDREYEINAGYPMPGITLFGGIGLVF